MNNNASQRDGDCCYSSAFQIVKEQIQLSIKKGTIFKDSFARTLKDGGAKQDRTADLLRARQALSQLSYSPEFWYISMDILFSLANYSKLATKNQSF